MLYKLTVLWKVWWNLIILSVLFQRDQGLRITLPQRWVEKNQMLLVSSFHLLGYFVICWICNNKKCSIACISSIFVDRFFSFFYVYDSCVSKYHWKIIWLHLKKVNKMAPLFCFPLFDVTRLSRKLYLY